MRTYHPPRVSRSTPPPSRSQLTLFGLLLALLVGATLGLLGSGGSILTVPIFVYALGVAPKPAIAMSLAAVGTTTIVGFVSHWRQGNVRIPTALLFGAFAMVGAFSGARLAMRIPSDVQLVIFAVAVLVASVLMLRNASRDLRATRQVETSAVTPASGVAADTVAVAMPAELRARASLAALGLVTGALTSVIGVGGGFLIVPALVLAGGLPMRQAVGTSLLVITMNALAGFAGYLGLVPIDWEIVGGFTGAAVVGIFVGSRLASRVPQARLKQAFAVLLLAVGVFVLLRR